MPMLNIRVYIIVSLKNPFLYCIIYLCNCAGTLMAGRKFFPQRGLCYYRPVCPWLPRDRKKMSFWWTKKYFFPIVGTSLTQPCASRCISALRELKLLHNLKRILVPMIPICNKQVLSDSCSSSSHPLFLNSSALSLPSFVFYGPWII